MKEASKSDLSILFRGSWTPNQVSISEVASSRLIDTNLEKAAQNAWNMSLVQAAKNGSKLWDSEAYRYESAHMNAASLVLRFSTIPFSIRLGMNKHTRAIKSLGPKFATRGLYTSCLVSTTDKSFVFIEKSKKFFTNKKYSWIGGILSKSEAILTSGSDLFEATKKEISEELGLTTNHIVSLLLRTGYLTDNWNVCLLFEASLSLTKTELTARFMQKNDGEAKNLLYISYDQIKKKEYDVFEPKDQVKFSILRAS
ncbi:MAG: hypothetical protein U0517_01620 [Candidatus Andersenbacteria bacterium]